MNRSLMVASGPDINVECKNTVGRLIGLYETPGVRCDDIRPPLRSARDRADEFGRFAEYNLCIAIGMMLTAPASITDTYAASFRRDARKCADYSIEMEISYMEMFVNQLFERVSRTNAQIDKILRQKFELSLMRAQRELEALRNQRAAQRYQ